MRTWGLFFSKFFLILCLVIASGACSRNQAGMPPGMVGVTPPKGFEGEFGRLEDNGVRNWVLHLNNIAVRAMQNGDHELASRALDEATLMIDSIQGGTDESARAKSPFFSEDAKIFKGEPYERTMTFLYRGILYMQAEDWENARASFRTAILQDVFAEDPSARGDWVLPDLLIAACEVRLNRPLQAAEAQERAHQNFLSVMETYEDVVLWRASRTERERFRRNFRIDLDERLSIHPDHNLIVITQYGDSPRKVRQGGSGQRLAFERGRVQTAPPIVNIHEYASVQSQFTDSLFFQSVTRGGREIDGLQARKALLKETTDVVGTGGLYAGGFALSRGISTRNEGMIVFGLITALVGGGVKVFSSLVSAQADIRQWGPLPDSLGVNILSLPEGNHFITVRTATDREVTREIYLPEPGQGLVVILAFPGRNPSLLIPPRFIAQREDFSE